MSAPPGPIEVTFVGNEGVLVDDGRRGILVDALFGDGLASYTRTPRAVVDAVETARPPFDRVDVVLATHHHPDHFNPYSVARHLQHNPRARFVSTAQAVEQLERRAPAFAEIRDRVTAVTPVEGELQSVDAGGVDVGAFGLSHGKVHYGDVQHLGLLIQFGGARVLHLGDGIIAERTLRSAGVFERPIDAAFLPFWYLTYPFGKRLRRAGFRPRHTFAIHIPPAEEQRLLREVADADPAVVALVEPLDRHTLPAPA